jgi:hypothetical protein
MVAAMPFKGKRTRSSSIPTKSITIEDPASPWYDVVPLNYSIVTGHDYGGRWVSLCGCGTLARHDKSLFAAEQALFH